MCRYHNTDTSFLSIWIPTSRVDWLRKGQTSVLGIGSEFFDTMPIFRYHAGFNSGSRQYFFFFFLGMHRYQYRVLVPTLGVEYSAHTCKAHVDTTTPMPAFCIFGYKHPWLIDWEKTKHICFRWCQIFTRWKISQLVPTKLTEGKTKVIKAGKLGDDLDRMLI